MLYMRTIPEKMRSDEVYVAACDSVIHKYRVGDQGQVGGSAGPVMRNGSDLRDERSFRLTHWRQLHGQRREDRQARAGGAALGGL